MCIGHSSAVTDWWTFRVPLKPDRVLLITCLLRAANAPAAGRHVNGRPKVNWRATCGHVNGRIAPGMKPACGRLACTRALHTRKENWPAAGVYLHGRFVPESKPACGRWACKRALHARKKPACGQHLFLFLLLFLYFFILLFLLLFLQLFLLLHLLLLLLIGTEYGMLLLNQTSQLEFTG